MTGQMDSPSAANTTRHDVIGAENTHKNPNQPTVQCMPVISYSLYETLLRIMKEELTYF